ncbi:multisubunit sodium/proton antiporter MrpC subunit [Novosphingobium sp. PhB165]|uniref:NADH-quinone oxidoreductase subunit K n=1 Tax=Novosphingobium sp. PhB165 TaxID=2485105 RepID=UPI001047905F|nr:NADH-quinone oxidoreductase subunit K [Novosphingobium sp. PhB165]TCM16018.1 multisubunit sodium/proton antiporter MrpC subunit [Novosphingobium sp. PhB165]
MTGATLHGLAAAILIGLGVFGLIAHASPLRKILAFNIVGSGVFLLAGALARRGAEAGFGGDPVLHAILITGIVVAFSATAMATAMLLRLRSVTDRTTLAETPPRHDADPPA